MFLSSVHEEGTFLLSLWGRDGLLEVWVPCRILDFAGDSAVIQLHIYSFKHQVNIQINLNKILISPHQQTLAVLE